MQILIIVGSPHKGNSTDLAERMTARLERYGDVECDTILLKDVELEPCRGCFTCFERGESRCPLRDDGRAIAEKLDAADGLILISPVYAMHVSYLLKRFIDRFSYVFHRPRFQAKYAMVAAVAGNIGLRPTLKYMKDVVDAWGYHCVDQLGLVAPPQHTKLRALSTKKDRTDEAVERLHSAIASHRRKRLTFLDHLGFRLMQASYGRLSEMSPTDYAYWRDKGWLDRRRRYFHDNVRVNWLFDGVTRLLAWVVGRQMAKALADAPES